MRFLLTISKKDGRCKNGVRNAGVYTFDRKNAELMLHEIKDLQRDLYKQEDGWILTFEEAPPCPLLTGNK